MKLIDKSAVVAEIKKHRTEWNFGNSAEAKYKKEECDDILSYLDTLEVKEVDVENLQEELVSEIILEGTNFNKSWYAHPELAFKAGAKWQKEQMMAKAIDGYVIEDVGNGDFVLSADYIPKSMGLKDGQSVKVIVIKKD